MEKTGNEIMDLSFEFSLMIVDYCEKLIELKKISFSKQLIRSGTSIGANIEESQHSESRSDFIHKMKLAAKEAAETSYWLKLCNEINSCPDPSPLQVKLLSIQKLLSRIISVSKSKL